MDNPFVISRPRSTHPVDVGVRTEMRIAGDLVALGFEVYTPLNPNTRADLIVDTGERLLRCQCKTGRLRDGAVLFRACSVRSNTKASLIRNYVGEVDFFLVFCPETDAVYAIPIDEATTSECRLRVDSSLNNQCVGVRWARDYVLPRFGAAA